MCDKEKSLGTRHSYHIHNSPKTAQPDTFSKSELNFDQPKFSDTSRSSNDACSDATKLSNKSAYGEYYKKYEHDEVPVKDSNNNSNSMTYTRSFHKGSLTNSALENLERRIFQNVSQELQTDDASLSSLDSNIKFFKTTVEKIFESFYTNMRDFEHYKTRFHEILNKSKEGSVDDMEDFIKDMFDHIMSLENSQTKVSLQSAEAISSEIEDREICAISFEDSATEHENCSGFLEAYKNEHYFTDSTFEENISKSSKTKSQFQIKDKFNIFLLNGNPCVEIKLDGRSMMSEVNMKSSARQSLQVPTESVVSADNFNRITAKKRAIEKYIRQQDDFNIHNMSDRDIPVKISSAKKNIHLDEDFARIHENQDSSKSFLSKLCSILCRKFRKSSLGS